MPHPADNREDFEHAYVECRPAVFRLALALSNDPDEAEDLVQDAFDRLWRARSRVDWSAPMTAWLLTTTRRLATDRFRRLRRRISLAWPLTGDRDPEDIAGWLDVQEAFGALTMSERGALVMVAVLGYSTEAAGAVLGMSPGAVRAAMSRGRSKLEQER